MIAQALGPEASGHRLILFASRERTIQLDSGARLEVRALEELPSLRSDVLLHFAYVTREFATERGAPDYVVANLAITAHVVDLIRKAPPRFLAYASSGAARAAMDSGRLDISGDPYGTLKVMDELALRRAMQDVGGRSLVLRVFNVSGRWLTKPGAFALSDIIQQVHAGGPVIIRARHGVVRSYVDVEDLARVMIASALDMSGPVDEVVETAGGEEVEVGNLAERVRHALGRPEVEIVRDFDVTAAPDRYVGEPGAFLDLASRVGVPLRDLDAQIARTAQGMGVPVANTT